MEITARRVNQYEIVSEGGEPYTDQLESGYLIIIRSREIIVHFPHYMYMYSINRANPSDVSAHEVDDLVEMVASDIPQTCEFFMDEREALAELFHWVRKSIYSG